MKTLSYNKELSYQGRKIPYILKIRDQKNIILKLQHSEIIVSAPYQAQDWEIEKIIYKNIHQIEKYVRFMDAHKVIELFGNDKFVKIWGEKESFVFDSDSDFELKKDSARFVFKKYEEQNETVLKMYNVLKKRFESEFSDRLKYWANIMQLDYKNLSVRWFKGKWGICYPQKSKILLNIRLIHYDKAALDYVCVHELSHLLNANHSKDFWHLVERYLPDYKKRAEILKIKLN
jgi:predicted metal-dependent hydrolase